jgi:hypothetical protein
VSIHLLEGPFLNSSINREYQMALKALGVRAFPLPTEEPLPTQTQYSLDRHPGDLYVSAPEVLNAPGRAAVQAYACEWGELRLQHLRLHRPHGAVPRPGRSGKLNQRLSRAAGGTFGRRAPPSFEVSVTRSRTSLPAITARRRTMTTCCPRSKWKKSSSLKP